MAGAVRIVIRTINLKPFKQCAKSFRVPIMINAIMLVCMVSFVVINQLSGFVFPGGRNDYQIYYYAARTFFNVDPLRLYDAAFFQAAYNLSPYRYFPAELVFFYPFTFMDSMQSYVVFSVICFFFSLATIYTSAKILGILGMATDASDPFSKKNSSWKYLAMFFMVAFQLTNYGMGQLSSYVAFFSVLGLYFFLKGNEMAGSIMVGLSIVFKPVAIFIVLFLLMERDIKRLIKRVFFIALPLLADAIIFLVNLDLLRSFIALNLNELGLSRFVLDPSLSFSYFISVLFQLPTSYVFIAATGACAIAGILLLRKSRDSNQRIVFSFIFGMASFFIAQPDIWETQLLYLYPFLAIAFTFMERDFKKPLLFYSYTAYPFACVLLIFEVPRIVVIPVVAIWMFLYYIAIAKAHVKNGWIPANPV